MIQEIFGVNHHMRNVCDRLAAEGCVAVAPAIFDRIEPNFTSTYSPEEIAYARKFVAHPDWAAMLRDTQAAIDAVKGGGPVGIIGFCLGAIVRFADDKPTVLTQLHFGDKDTGIPMSDVETIKTKRPDVEILVYPGAQHGFSCDERPSFDKQSADIAWPCAMTFFAEHLKS